MRKLFLTFLTFALLFFAQSAGAIQTEITTTTYDGFGCIGYNDTGTLQLYYRQGPGQGSGKNELGEGTIVRRTSSDHGDNWSASATTIKADSGFDLRISNSCYFSSDGKTIIVAYFKEVSSDASWVGSYYIKSTDGGITFGPETSLSAKAVNGKIIDIGAGKIAVAAYLVTGCPSTCGNVLLDSSNLGDTWTERSTVFSSGSINTDEMNIVYLGDSRILAIVRQEPNTATGFRQIVSTDNGQTNGGWTDLGLTTFENFNCSCNHWPGHLEKYGDTVALFYGNRGSNKLDVTTAKIDAVITSASAWAAPTDLGVTIIQSGPSLGGYPYTIILRGGTNAKQTLVYYYYQKTDDDVANGRFTLWNFSAPFSIRNGGTITAGSGKTITAGSFP